MNSTLQTKIDYKRRMQLKEAVKVAFRLMNVKFYAADLIGEVRLLTGKQEFDSTILRTLRQLRQENPQEFNWSCIDLKKALYFKNIILY